jgi:hypothetical protein
MKRSILLGLAISTVAVAVLMGVTDVNATAVPQPASISSPATAATGNQPTVIG